MTVKGPRSPEKPGDALRLLGNGSQKRPVPDVDTVEIAQRIDTAVRRGGQRSARPQIVKFHHAEISDVKIILDQRIQKLVTVDLADQRAGIAVACNIRGVFRKNIAHDLIDGVIALLTQRLVNRI